MATPEENKKLIRFLIEEGLNKGNLELDQYFTQDYEVHIPSAPPGPRGPEAFKRVIGMWRTAFPDWHLTIECMIAEGDFVANRFTTRGTHQAPLMGMRATGKQMIVHGQELHRLVDGKVAETWVCDDVPSILAQLGLLPTVQMAIVKSLPWYVRTMLWLGIVSPKGPPQPPRG